MFSCAIFIKGREGKKVAPRGIPISECDSHFLAHVLHVFPNVSHIHVHCEVDNVFFFGMDLVLGLGGRGNKYRTGSIGVSRVFSWWMGFLCPMLLGGSVVG